MTVCRAPQRRLGLVRQLSGQLHWRRNNRHGKQPRAAPNQANQSTHHAPSIPAIGCTKDACTHHLPCVTINHPMQFIAPYLIWLMLVCCVSMPPQDNAWEAVAITSPDNEMTLADIKVQGCFVLWHFHVCLELYAKASLLSVNTGHTQK